MYCCDGGPATSTASSSSQWYAVQKTGWQHKQSGVLLFMLIVLETTCWKWWIWILQIKVKIKGLNIYLFCRATIIVHLNTNFLAINFDGYGHGVMELEMSQIWKHKTCSGWWTYGECWGGFSEGWRWSAAVAKDLIPLFLRVSFQVGNFQIHL